MSNTKPKDFDEWIVRMMGRALRMLYAAVQLQGLGCADYEGKTRVRWFGDGPWLILGDRCNVPGSESESLRPISSW